MVVVYTLAELSEPLAAFEAIQTHKNSIISNSEILAEIQNNPIKYPELSTRSTRRIKSSITYTMNKQHNRINSQWSRNPAWVINQVEVKTGRCQV